MYTTDTYDEVNRTEYRILEVVPNNIYYIERDVGWFRPKWKHCTVCGSLTEAKQWLDDFETLIRNPDRVVHTRWIDNPE